MFEDTIYDFPYTGTFVPFTILGDGIYEFEIFGAAGGDASGTANSELVTAKGGKGGHVKAYKRMKRGDVVYIFNGGRGGYSAGVNGGGNAKSLNGNDPTKYYGAAGGGATHMALYSGALGSTQSEANENKSLDYAHRENILIVAGGGGGGWYGGGYGENGQSGAGGSGYIGGMPSFTLNKVYYPAVNEAGVNEGNGYSYIRYIKCI